MNTHTLQRVLQPVVLFPLLAAASVLAVFAVIQGGLGLAARWDQSLMARAEYYQSHRPAVLVTRYEQRLSAVRVALRKRGYDAGPVNAAMGPRTAEALRSFQRRQGLPVTGRADESTVTALGIQQ
jgi:peptidoglycan hydrolase-like protein with peptidoglycan-binding domain